MANVRAFALFGHPVAHSLSPVIHATAYAVLGLPHLYTAVDVATDGALVEAVDTLRLGVIHGANITLPHKQAVLGMCDEVHPSAAASGAANVLCRSDAGRITAYNTDASALAADIDALWTDAPRLRAMIIGAGGAGLSAVVACRTLGFKVIAVTTRSWTSTEAVMSSPQAERMRAMGALTLPWPNPELEPSDRRSSAVLRTQWPELSKGATLVVQATSAGMLGGDLGEPVAECVPWGMLGKGTLAYDVVYTPRMTPFLRAAAARGLRAEGGLGMLVRQAAEAIVLWTGHSPPLDVMRRAAEGALDRGGHSV